jgi:hypothetical protein
LVELEAGILAAEREAKGLAEIEVRAAQLRGEVQSLSTQKSALESQVAALTDASRQAQNSGLSSLSTITASFENLARSLETALIRLAEAQQSPKEQGQ